MSRPNTRPRISVGVANWREVSSLRTIKPSMAPTAAISHTATHGPFTKPNAVRHRDITTITTTVTLLATRGESFRAGCGQQEAIPLRAGPQIIFHIEREQDQHGDHDELEERHGIEKHFHSG